VIACGGSPARWEAHDTKATIIPYPPKQRGLPQVGSKEPGRGQVRLMERAGSLGMECASVGRKNPPTPSPAP